MSYSNSLRARLNDPQDDPETDFAEEWANDHDEIEDYDAAVEEGRKAFQAMLREHGLFQRRYESYR
jgi:hypothetical protein